MQAISISSSKCIAPTALSLSNGRKARVSASRPALRKTVVATASSGAGDVNEVAQIMSLEDMSQPMAGSQQLFELATFSGQAVVQPVRPQPPMMRPFVPAAAGVCAVGMGAKMLIDLSTQDIDYTNKVENIDYSPAEEAPVEAPVVAAAPVAAAAPAAKAAPYRPKNVITGKEYTRKESQTWNGKNVVTGKYFTRGA